MDFKNKTVWITGASSGIGEALVYEFNRLGSNVILSARRKPELERVKTTCEHPENCFIYPLDLTDAEQIENIAEKVIDTFGKVDMLINNSGISQRSLISETPLHVDRQIMELNYFGTIHLTKKVLPGMVEQKSGHVVAISSVVGKFGFPMRSAYSASKHALHGFFETLYTEQRRNNIFVTIVFPGRIRTNISKNAVTKTGDAYGIMDPGQEKGMDPNRCAKKIIKAIKRKKIEVFVGGREGIMVMLRKYLPHIYFKIAQKVSPT